ncbi:hypothetical protein ScPMuIL_003216 [Solemya velum]
MHVEVEHIKLGQGCEMMVEEAIDSAEKSDGWVLIEDLHTAPTRLFNELRKHLVRVAKTRDNLPEDKKKAMLELRTASLLFTTVTNDAKSIVKCGYSSQM